MARFQSTNDEFKKLKEGLINDVKIMQTQYVNSQKQLKLAEEIIQKTKEEYKKLNDKYIKLENYKAKCEKYIKYLQNENSDIQLKLNSLYEQLQEQNNHSKYQNSQNTSNNYYRLRKYKEEEKEEEEEQNEEEQNEEEEEDITEIENKNLITETKLNRGPPRKKIKKGISHFI